MTEHVEAAQPRTLTFSMDIDAALGDAARRMEESLHLVLPSPAARYGRIQEAMHYAVFGGGKRLRPFLTLHCAALFGVPEQGAARAAAAIEVLHCYSLVHDDLPCMDDDDLRRGRATVHRRFDEATAVLAGDGLLTLAFEILSSKDTHPNAAVRCELTGRLAEAAGSDGMIGGQMMDMLASQSSFGAEDVAFLQSMKTGALFEFSCEAGAILGQADAGERSRLRAFGRNLGIAFQIADDLIDVLGNSDEAGKAVGKDEAQGKATLVSLLGAEEAYAQARHFAAEAAETLENYGAAAADLRALPYYLLDRMS